MHPLTEARLASDLSDQLSTLQALETFNRVNQTEVSIVWRDGSVSNTATSVVAMNAAVTTIVAENLDDLFATAVARQREKVSAARTALLGFVFDKATDTKLDESLAAATRDLASDGEAAVLRTTAVTHDLSQDETNSIGASQTGTDQAENGVDQDADL